MWANFAGITQLHPDIFWDLTLNEYNKIMKAAYVRCGLEEVEQHDSRAEYERLKRDYGGTSRSIKPRGNA